MVGVVDRGLSPGAPPTIGDCRSHIADARWLLSQYQRYAAYSDAQAAWGRLYNSVGLDVMPDVIDNHDVATLAAEIQKTMNGWERTTLLAQGEAK